MPISFPIVSYDIGGSILEGIRQGQQIRETAARYPFIVPALKEALAQQHAATVMAQAREPYAGSLAASEAALAGQQAPHLAAETGLLGQQAALTGQQARYYAPNIASEIQQRQLLTEIARQQQEQARKLYPYQIQEERIKVFSDPILKRMMEYNIAQKTGAIPTSLLNILGGAPAPVPGIPAGISPAPAAGVQPVAPSAQAPIPTPGVTPTGIERPSYAPGILGGAPLIPTPAAPVAGAPISVPAAPVAGAPAPAQAQITPQQELASYLATGETATSRAQKLSDLMQKAQVEAMGKAAAKQYQTEAGKEAGMQDQLNLLGQLGDVYEDALKKSPNLIKAARYMPAEWMQDQLMKYDTTGALARIKQLQISLGVEAIKQIHIGRMTQREWNAIMATFPNINMPPAAFRAALKTVRDRLNEIAQRPAGYVWQQHTPAPGAAPATQRTRNIADIPTDELLRMRGQ